MTQETEHTEFEKEAKKYGLDSRRAAGAYYDSQTMTAFCLWQTARARGGRGEVDRAFDDGARFAIAMKSAKPVEVGELARQCATPIRLANGEYDECGLETLGIHRHELQAKRCAQTILNKYNVTEKL